MRCLICKVKVMMLVCVCVCAVSDVFCGGRAALLQRGGRCEHGPEAALAAVLPAAPRHRDGDGREQGGRSGGDRRPGRAAVHPRVEQQQPADRGGAGRLPPQSHRAPQVLLRRRSLGQRRSEPSNHIVSYHGHAMLCCLPDKKWCCGVGSQVRTTSTAWGCTTGRTATCCAGRRASRPSRCVWSSIPTARGWCRAATRSSASGTWTGARCTTRTPS